jgi:cytoskeletal protein CcmA (bactofilin family)
MFGRKKSRTARITTVIGPSARVTGDIEFSGGLHLDGVVRGDVRSAPDAEDPTHLVLSDQGRIEGDVHVTNLLLNGAVVGDVYVSERLELAANAKVTGTVYYHLLEMAVGAQVNGQLVHREAEVPRLEHNSPAESDQGIVMQQGQEAAGAPEGLKSDIPRGPENS